MTEDFTTNYLPVATVVDETLTTVDVIPLEKMAPKNTFCAEPRLIIFWSFFTFLFLENIIVFLTTDFGRAVNIILAMAILCTAGTWIGATSYCLYYIKNAKAVCMCFFPCCILENRGDEQNDNFKWDTKRPTTRHIIFLTVSLLNCIAGIMAITIWLSLPLEKQQQQPSPVENATIIKGVTKLTFA